ncbi:hypothetical protein [Sphingomonas sp.]|uniref:hypothetical protein n=1 Tax=Sphingomonas sp. TaxID=28214 RepID=UPI001ED01829|nr:hypothetical protein [Sphingomonas sp.]MBX3594031.1 hypothetical protein [Sphingomonas sp.]
MKLIALAAALAMTGTAAIAQDMTTPPATTATTGQTMDDPVGGYQPSTPPMSAQPLPGQQVIFQPSKSPTEAYPPPPPMASYPICKKGQYDNCRQRGG